MVYKVVDKVLTHTRENLVKLSLQKNKGQGTIKVSQADAWHLYCSWGQAPKPPREGFEVRI
ncbi:hypothetical protein NHP21005_19600 (plasmid) [Helicobacter sp. NHP21005]|nr:hypothetical protein NHP21005_19060 [Helicobacter sp. NHP21005]BEG58272.1 hypothetical protein NHP21005_19600 [Helicobacter sp. NHP21005]